MKRRPRIPMAAKVFEKIASPVDKLMQLDSASGIVLLLATMAAMFFANSPLREAYEHFLHTPIGLSVGSWSLSMSFQHAVNDFLMAIFFFVVGMEIKKELVSGTLSDPKKAALPLIAAIGGMIVPAIIYYFFNKGGEGSAGWGIPMATDIAFAVGVLSFMSKKVPFSLKIFLLALAIVDDLGAVIVIALFYTQQIQANFIAFAFILMGLIYLLLSSGIRKTWIYIPLGLCSWYFIYQSGLHATIAGVLLGFLVPLESFYDEYSASKKLKSLADELDKEIDETGDGITSISHIGKKRIDELYKYSMGARSRLEATLDNLHNWVTYLILPCFAFANTGVILKNLDFLNFLSQPISLGIILGLFLGKPLGVFLFSFIAIKSGVASLPHKVTWYKIFCTGIIAGIGFTMSLFISNLALGSVGEGLENISKLSILLASVLAGVAGVFALALSSDIDESKAN